MSPRARTGSTLLLVCGLLAASCAARDAGPPPDSGAPIEDAGAVVDAGPTRDGGQRRDGGPVRIDGGSVDDGGAADDGGTVDDGGALDDGGAVADGGARDGGLVLPDAGVVACETGGATMEMEPNDRASQAQVIGPAQAVRGKLTPEVDEDWYVFVACRKTLLELTLDMNGPAVPPPDAGAPFSTRVDPRIDVLGADGTTLLNWVQNRNGRAGPTSIKVVALVEAAGPVYLRISDLGNDGRDDDSTYTLTATPLPIPDADLEPDGNKGPALSATLAHPLTPNVLAQAYLASTRDEDWYQLDAPGLTLLDVTLTDAPALGTPLSYRVRVLAADGLTEIGRGEARPPGPSASVNLRMRAQLPTAGRYYLVVSDQGDAADRTRPYRLVYQLAAVPDLALEPNDRPSHARPITLGATTSAYIAAPSDEDWFSVVVPQPSILRAELTLPTGLRTAVDYRVSLFNPDGLTEIAQATDFDGQFGDVMVIAAAFAVGGPAPYYVRVSDWRADDFDVTLPYALTVTTLTLPDAALEPNDTPPQATLVPVVVGTPATRTAYIATQRDVDFFGVEVAEGQTLTAALTSASTPVQYRLSIRDRLGANRLADAFDVNGRMLPNELSVTAPFGTPPMPLAAGRYFITVEDLGGDDFDPGVPYTLTISLTGP